MFIGVHLCSTRVRWCSLVSIGVLLVFIGVHWCSLVSIGVLLMFIGVHSCSHSCGVSDWIPNLIITTPIRIN